MAGPAEHILRCKRRNAGNGAFRHIARHRRVTIDPVAAIEDNIDRIGDVRTPLLQKRGSGLRGEKRLGMGGGQHHHLDAETGIDGVDTVGQKPDKLLDVAHRSGGAGPHRLQAAIDPMQYQINPAGTEAALFALRKAP